MFCPNHHRTKRPAKGGGYVGCGAHVTVTLLVPVEIRVKPGGLKSPLLFERMVPRRIARHGLRLKPADLAAAFHGTGTLRRRIGCRCGWSMERLAVAPLPARRTGRAGG